MNLVMSIFLRLQPVAEFAARRSREETQCAPKYSDRCQLGTKARGASRRRCTMPYRTVPSAPRQPSISLRQVIYDSLRVGLFDRRSVDLHHLADLGLPKRLTPFGRLRRDVISRMRRNYSALPPCQ